VQREDAWPQEVTQKKNPNAHKTQGGRTTSQGSPKSCGKRRFRYGRKKRANETQQTLEKNGRSSESSDTLEKLKRKVQWGGKGFAGGHPPELRRLTPQGPQSLEAHSIGQDKIRNKAQGGTWGGEARPVQKRMGGGL